MKKNREQAIIDAAPYFITNKKVDEMKRVLKWAGNLFFVFLIIISISSLYLIAQSRIHPHQIPAILGYKAMIVLSGSMQPLLESGDLIIVKEADMANVNENDVITYRNTTGTFVTHRIVNKMVKDGDSFFITKGDANNIEDQEIVTHNQVEGRLLFSIPKAGYVVNFLKSGRGFILLVLTVTTILIIGIVKKYIQETKRNITT